MNYLAENKITVSGRLGSNAELDHAIMGEKFYRTSVAIRRNSGAEDVIPVIVSDRVVNVNTLVEGTYVGIDGSYRSFNKQDENGKNKLILFIFATSVNFNVDDPEDVNEIHLIGGVCKLPTNRVTPNGRDITDIMLSVNRSYGKTDYIPLIIWGRNAKYAAKFHIGDTIEIFGRLQSRTYNKVQANGDSKEMVAYEVSVSRVEVIDEAN